MYDFLAKLVFGKNIIVSQTYFLNRIQDHAKVLVLGGGSGWLLAELLKIKPNCEVWYIEASGKMIAMSKNTVDAKYAVHFIHGTEQDIPPSVKFDAVIANFYFDVFTQRQLADVVTKIRLSLQTESRWIVTDFIDNRWWQKLLLKTMYRFFRIACSLESQQLPEWDSLMEKSKVIEIESKLFYRGFIKTILYRC
jgi:ubiquinone/menaquinone biosynthesis C-methylase UbiE